MCCWFRIQFVNVSRFCLSPMLVALEVFDLLFLWIQVSQPLSLGSVGYPQSQHSFIKVGGGRNDDIPSALSEAVTASFAERLIGLAESDLACARASFIEQNSPCMPIQNRLSRGYACLSRTYYHSSVSIITIAVGSQVSLTCIEYILQVVISSCIQKALPGGEKGSDTLIDCFKFLQTRRSLGTDKCQSI